MLYSHYIKIITTDVRKIVRDKRLARFRISALVKILTGSSFIEVDTMVNSLPHIYLNPKWSKALQVQFEKLCNDVVEQEIDEEVELNEDKYKTDQEEAGAIYKASPFYKRYLGKTQDIAKQITVTDDPVNEYYNDKLTVASEEAFTVPSALVIFYVADRQAGLLRFFRM